MAKTRWSVIPEFDNRYSISIDGQVKNNKSQRLKSIWTDKDGYSVVTLNYKGKGHTRRIARLVAQAFIPNPKGLPQVNHIDENKSNDEISNLGWVTQEQNMTHGTLQERKGEKLRKPVVMVKNNDVLEFGSIREASEQTGVCYHNISAVCNKRPHRKTARGYRCYFKEDYYGRTHSLEKEF